MRRLGTTTRVRTCDACGKSDLARTVVFADGARKVHLGADCARKRLPRRHDRADRMYMPDYMAAIQRDLNERHGVKWFDAERKIRERLGTDLREWLESGVSVEEAAKRIAENWQPPAVPAVYVGDEMPKWVKEGARVKVKMTPWTRKNGVSIGSGPKDYLWPGEIGTIRRNDRETYWDWKIHFPMHGYYGERQPTLSSRLLDDLVRVSSKVKASESGSDSAYATALSDDRKRLGKLTTRLNKERDPQMRTYLEGEVDSLVKRIRERESGGGGGEDPAPYWRAIGPRPPPSEISFDPRCFEQVPHEEWVTVPNPGSTQYPERYATEAEARKYARGRRVVHEVKTQSRRIAWKPPSDGAVAREPGVTVSSRGQVKRNGRLLGFAHSKYGTMPNGKFGKIGESSTTSRTDGRSIHKLHATREDAIAYVLAHGWAYGDPPKDTDERG